MLIKRCDRCGKEEILNSFEDKISMCTIMKKASEELPKAWDICSDCIASFDRWIKNTDILVPISEYKMKDEKPPVKRASEIEPEIISKEEALDKEINDLENKMNNAYARGNDNLGDKIAERLSKKYQEKKPIKEEKKFSNKKYVSKALIFKSHASKNAFIAKHRALFVPYCETNIGVVAKVKKDAGAPLSPDVRKKMKEDMKHGYYDDLDNKNGLRIHIDPKQFKNLEHYFSIKTSGYNNHNVVYVEK